MQTTLDDENISKLNEKVNLEVRSKNGLIRRDAKNPNQALPKNHLGYLVVEKRQNSDQVTRNIKVNHLMMMMMMMCKMGNICNEV